MSSTINKPHSTHRIDYLKKCLEDEIARDKENIQTSVDNESFDYMIQWQLADLAAFGMKREILQIIEYHRDLAEKHGTGMAQGDLAAMNEIVSRMFRVILTQPIHNSSNSGFNAMNEAKIMYARIVLDKLGLDSYRISNEGPVAAMVKSVCPNMFEAE